MKHLGRGQSIKRLLWNQAGVEVTVDNCHAFAREVTKLRQFVLLACIFAPTMAASASRVAGSNDARVFLV
jgi:endonuclease IV